MSPKYSTKASLNCGMKSGYQERTHGHGKNMYTAAFSVWLRRAKGFLASWIPNCDFVGCRQNPPNRNNSAGHVCHITFLAHLSLPCVSFGEICPFHSNNKAMNKEKHVSPNVFYLLAFLILRQWNILQNIIIPRINSHCLYIDMYFINKNNTVF